MDNRDHPKAGANQRMNKKKVSKERDRHEIFERYTAQTKDPVSIVYSAQEGVPASIFNDVTVLYGNRDYMAEVVDLTPRTLKTYINENKKLTPSRSEILLKMISLYAKGIEVFGAGDAFNRWLTKPAFGLGNKIPLEFLKTSDGIDLITDELTRIEFGDTA